MLKLNSALNLDVGEFLRWWWSEIESLLPEKARSMLLGTKQLLIARPEEGGYSLTHFLDGKEIPLGTFEAGSIGKAQFEELLEKKPELSSVDWVLRLQKQDAIQKRLVLPAVAAENLEQVVQYELDRFTPFTPGQVYFAVKVLDKKAQSNQLEAQLILTPREKLDACYNELREWGVRPVVADYQEFSNRFENKRNFYNLLPESLRLKQNRIPGIIVSGLVLLVVILFCLVLITPVWMEHETVEVLDDQVARLEKEARKVESLKTEIDDLYAETRELIRLKKSS
ncbi:MAG: pilus assembly protein PilM, partial [Gammaproteobacteria bacterium]